MARQTTISFPSLFDSPASNMRREDERKRHRKAMDSPRRSCDSSSDSGERESSSRAKTVKESLGEGGAFPPFTALFEIGDKVTIDDAESHMWGGGIITKVVFPGDPGNELDLDSEGRPNDRKEILYEIDGFLNL